MKKFNSFLLYLILLNVFVLVIGMIYHIRVEKLDKIWLLYRMSLDVVFFLPLNASLAIFWPLIFRDKAEMQNPISKTTLGYFTILYIFITLGIGFAFQEILVPVLYNRADYLTTLKENKLEAPKVRIKDTTAEKFQAVEFNNVRFMPMKENIAFSMGNSFVYFEKMYDGSGSYYIQNFRIISYTAKKQIDYIVSGDRGKLVDGELYALSPFYFAYAGGQLSSVKRMDGIKKIPIVYDADGIFALSSEATAGIASLVDVFKYSDYIYNSKINFYHLGNIVFNKVAYYILLAVMLILAVSFGSSLRNQRQIQREYVQTGAFFIVSFALTAILYDTLVSVINMIYGMII